MADIPAQIKRDVEKVLEVTVHADHARGYRVGEIFNKLAAESRSWFKTVGTFNQTLEAHLDALNIDCVRVMFPSRPGQRPHDGVYTVFFSLDE